MDSDPNANISHPPVAAVANTDIASLIQEAVSKAVAAQLEAAQVAGGNVAAAVHQLSPEEAARAALDNAGVGLGVEERLQELYKHLSLIAAKVGI